MSRGIFYIPSHMWQHADFRLLALGFLSLLLFLLVLIFIVWKEERWTRVVRMFESLFSRWKRQKNKD